MKEMDYDLAERTASFGEAVIEFCLDLPANPVSAPLVSQLIRTATSIGANDCEADDAESKKDFRHKIGLCRKEARETKEQPVGPPLTVAYPTLKFDMMADVSFPQAASH